MFFAAHKKTVVRNMLFKVHKSIQWLSAHLEYTGSLESEQHQQPSSVLCA